MAEIPMTLSEHLATQETPRSAGRDSINTLIMGFARIAAVIAQELVRAAAQGGRGFTGSTNVTGDRVRTLDAWGHETMVSALRATGACAALVSEESAEPVEMATGDRGRALVVCADPIDGSSNLDVDGAVGTIFGLRPFGGQAPAAPQALGPGTDQVAAGYILYGPATTLVYTVGEGTHAFVLNPQRGEFVLTHQRIQIPNRGKTYGINEGYVRTWHPGQRAFVERLKSAGAPGGRPYSLRYSGTMVADVHRTLLEGGLFMYPADWTDPQTPKAKLRLLYEVAPISFVIEQAGGRASTGFGRVLDVAATEYHQRTAVILGSPEDVALADEFYRSS